HAPVRPDVDEAIRLTEFDPTGHDQRRQLRPLRNLRFPALGGVGQGARLERVVAQLEDRSDLAGPHIGQKGEWDEDFRLHRANDLRNLRWPVRVLGRFAADPGTLGQIAVGPDVDDFVQRPDLGVQEGGELRVILAVLVTITEELLYLVLVPRTY